jgi:hypothetical protein
VTANSADARPWSSSTPSPRTIVIAGLFAAVGLSYIGPVSGYLSEKSTLRSEEIGLTALQGRRTELSTQLTELKQPAVLETRAREIGMLRPGEQGFVIDFASPKPAVSSSSDFELFHKLPGAS